MAMPANTLPSRSPDIDAFSRQNCSTMLSRHPRMLQDPRACRSRTPCPQALGASRPSQGRSQGRHRGGHAHAPSTSCEPRTLRPGDPRCWPHADCERFCNGAGHWSGAEEQDRRGHWALEAALSECCPPVIATQHAGSGFSTAQGPMALAACLQERLGSFVTATSVAIATSDSLHVWAFAGCITAGRALLT